MSRQAFKDGVLFEEWDDATRTYTDYSTEPPTSRPYTAAENASVDAQIVAEAQDSNKRTIQEALTADLTAMQEIINQTNADLRADPAQEIKSIARAIRRIDRMILGDFTGTE